MVLWSHVLHEDKQTKTMISLLAKVAKGPVSPFQTQLKNNNKSKGTWCIVGRYFGSLG